MSLEQLNSADEAEASHLFRQCCTSDTWIARMVSCRPFEDAEALHSAADQNWQDLAEADYLEALEGHPKIGDLGSLKARFANTKELAAGEQSGVNSASDKIVRALARGNSDYERKFGFIFIVCASGKSAGEMCDLLNARLLNDRETELSTAAEEQRKIFHIRLEKML